MHQQQLKFQKDIEGISLKLAQTSTFIHGWTDEFAQTCM